MKKLNSNNINFLTAIWFVIIAICDFVMLIRNRSGALYVICDIIVVIAFLKSFPRLSVISFVLQLVLRLIGINELTFGLIAIIAFYALEITASVKPEYAKNLCVAAAIIRSIGWVVATLPWFVGTSEYSMIFPVIAPVILYGILDAVGAILLGLAFYGTTEEK